MKGGRKQTSSILAVRTDLQLFVSNYSGIAFLQQRILYSAVTKCVRGACNFTTDRPCVVQLRTTQGRSLASF
jgi:hypothetical protein